MIKITEVHIRKLENRGVLKGFADIELYGGFVVKGIAILESEKGRWIGMPSRRMFKGRFKFRDICFPTSQEVRDLITTVVWDAYDNSEQKAKK